MGLFSKLQSFAFSRKHLQHSFVAGLLRRVRTPNFEPGNLETKTISVGSILIKSLQNRLLKVCYVPVTRAGLPRVSFFFSFLFFVAAAINSTNEANKAGSTCHKAVYILRCLWLDNGVAWRN